VINSKVFETYLINLDKKYVVVY